MHVSHVCRCSEWLVSLAQIRGKFVSDFEKPGEFICSTAKTENASFVVMGTRGLGKLRRTIMGSVSDYVVHHAACPVLVCRNPDKTSAAT